MKISAIRADMKMRYICWRRRGPFQWTTIIPITPKFHMQRVKVIQSMGKLYDLMTSEQYRNEKRKSSRNDERMSQPLMR